MSTVRFVHCADLHLDTPFRGLAHIAPDVAEALNNATFRAYDNVIDLAIEEQVDCVIVAGDVYDSFDRSLRAQFRFRDGLQRLSDNGIAAFVAFGNHDPLREWTKSVNLEWPALTHVFGSRRVDNCPLTRGGEVVASLHGISFGKPAITEDLAAQFEAPHNGVPSIAVLHANVGGDTGHDNYAPTTVAELAEKGFDYWALGHVHAHRILRENAPAIVYPGCSQSRQPNETGAKGCCLVTLSDGHAPAVRFVPIDVVRFHQSAVDVSACDSIDAVRRAVVEHCDTAQATAEDRSLVVRLSLTGRTSVSRELRRGGNLADLTQNLREALLPRIPWILLERLIVDTRGAYDIETLATQQDFSGDIVREYTSLLSEDSPLLEQVKDDIEVDLRTSPAWKLLTPPSRAELRHLAERAMHETLDLTVGED
jgi:DNA repair protein SbcD/Mre11